MTEGDLKAPDIDRIMAPMDEVDEEMVVCACSGTRLSQLKKRFADGLTTLEELSDATGVVSGCGGCEWDIGDLLKAWGSNPEDPATTELLNAGTSN